MIRRPIKGRVIREHNTKDPSSKTTGRRGLNVRSGDRQGGGE